MDKQFFNKDLFRKVFYLEWSLLLICSAAEVLSWKLAPPDPTAPDLRVSLILLGIVGALSVMAPVKGSYWDRFCFLILELLLVTGATAAGLARFLFPLFVVVVAKACLMLDRRGMIAIFLMAVFSSLVYAAFKVHLQYPFILQYGFTPRAVVTLLSASFVVVYVAIVLMVLVAMLTMALESEARSRRETERLSDEVQQLATELERSRIAREIHDSLGHTLTSLNIQLDVARKFQQREPDKSSEALCLAKELASQSLTDVRMAIQSIRSGTDFNFQEAVNGLVNDVQQTQESMKVELNMQVQEVPSSVGYQLFRVIQECLTNVLKHADASQVTILLEQTPEQLELRVRDNGKGVEEPRLNSGFGIRGMQERIESMHGTVAIDTAPNQGTKIDVHIPLRLLDSLEPVRVDIAPAAD